MVTKSRGRPEKKGTTGTRKKSKASARVKETTLEDKLVGTAGVVTNAIGMQFKLVPAGEFVMGTERWPLMKPLHPVRISKPFYIGVYPVTQQEWEKVMGSNPSKFKGEQRPVEKVSWEDCHAFLERLNTLEPGANYRLPTEAEWEYACRAGSQGRFCFGDNDKKLGDYAWYDANSGEETHPVGEKQPNGWGLFDMHGNVWEWCEDWYGDDWYKICHAKGIVEDPHGPEFGPMTSAHVMRGGSHVDDAEHATSGFRAGAGPSANGDDLGFRVVRPKL